jgi:hypothetical protein
MKDGGIMNFLIYYTQGGVGFSYRYAHSQKFLMAVRGLFFDKIANLAVAH